MKLLKVYLLLITLIIISCGKKSLYFDEHGKQLTKTEFQEQYRDSLNGLAYWEKENDTARIISLHPEFKQYEVSYSSFLQKLQQMTGKEFDNNSVVIISYEYRDDLCAKRGNHFWSKRRIAEEKDFTDDIKTNIGLMNKELIYLVIFEQGIKLLNEPGSEDEYFFSDKGNFLRNSIFKNPTTCGSVALLRPPGEILVTHSEGRTDIVAQKFLPDNAWHQLFPPKK